MRSTPEVSSMGVMFSVHKDSVWSMLPPRTFSVGFEGGVKIWGLLFSWYSSSWTCDLSQFFRCFSPRRSDLIIGIHRIMIHTDQIPQSCGDTYIVCVCMVSRCQIDQLHPFSVSLIIFYAGGRYKLLNQWKMSFSWSNPSRVSIQRENNEKLVVFDAFIDTWCLVEISKFGSF